MDADSSIAGERSDLDRALLFDSTASSIGLSDAPSDVLSDVEVRHPSSDRTLFFDSSDRALFFDSAESFSGFDGTLAESSDSLRDGGQAPRQAGTKTLDPGREYDIDDDCGLMAWLPAELLFAAASHLDLPSVLSLSRTCRYARDVLASDAFWCTYGDQYWGGPAPWLLHRRRPVLESITSWKEWVVFCERELQRRVRSATEAQFYMERADGSGYRRGGLSQRHVEIAAKLFFAAEHGHKYLITRVLTDAHDFPPNILNHQKQSMLYVAALWDQFDAAIMFLDRAGAPINAMRENGSTALYIACMMENTRIAEVLIERGADWTLECAHQSALDLVMSNENLAAVAQCIRDQMVKQSGEVDVSRLDDRARLIHAASCDHVEAMMSNPLWNKMLVEDVDRTTPLHYAARSGSLEAVKKLLARGYNPIRESTVGVTPLHFAVKSGRIEVVCALLEAAGKNVWVDVGGGHHPLLLPYEHKLVYGLYVLAASGSDGMPSYAQGLVSPSSSHTGQQREVYAHLAAMVAPKLYRRTDRVGAWGWKL